MAVRARKVVRVASPPIRKEPILPNGQKIAQRRSIPMRNMTPQRREKRNSKSRTALHGRSNRGVARPDR